MNRTPLAAAVAAAFLLATTSVLAQSTGAAGTTSGATSSGSTATGTSAGTSSGMTSGSKASAKGSSSLSHGDRKFMENAAEGGMKEVEMGRLASTQGADPAVKSYGEQLVKDHTDANQKLQALAQSKGVTLPTKMKDERTVKKMQGMTGAKFDKAFMDDMVKDHKKDTKEFDTAAKNAKDPDLQKFAADTAPVLHRHLDMAQDIQKNLGKGGSHASASSGTSSGK